MLEPWQLLILVGIACAAGFVDAIAGGGGMITLPALLACGLPPQVALGTNKLQSSFGSGAATWHFARAGLLRWSELRRGVAFTAAGALAGAFAVQSTDPALLRRMIPMLLIGVALFLLFKPGFGSEARSAKMGRVRFDVICGLAIGFYDGFLGPGTGTFWAMAFVMLLGSDLVRATAGTKAMNFTSNLASLAFFLAAGQVYFTAGLLMGLGQWIGARLGARMVLRRGSRFVRWVMLLVAVALALRLLA